MISLARSKIHTLDACKQIYGNTSPITRLIVGFMIGYTSIDARKKTSLFLYSAPTPIHRYIHLPLFLLDDGRHPTIGYFSCLEGTNELQETDNTSHD